MITIHFTGHVGRDAEIKEVNGKKYQTCNVMQVEILGCRQDQQTAQTAPAQGGAEEEGDPLRF